MIPVAGFKYNAGIAYVAIPSDLDRATYIADCYKNWHVSVRTEDGGFLNRVPITPEVLNFIEFPLTPSELGTCVQYVTDEQHQTTFIVNRFANREEIGDGREHMFQLRRKYKGQFVEISGSAKEGFINLFVDAKSIKGGLNIHINSDNDDALLNIDIAGILKTSTKSTQLTQTDSFEVSTTDGDNESSYQQTATENKFFNKRFIVNDGENPAVLGNEIKTFLGNFIDEVSKITVNGSPISNLVQVQDLKKKLDDMLSKEMFLNK